MPVPEMIQIRLAPTARPRLVARSRPPGSSFCLWGPRSNSRSHGFRSPLLPWCATRSRDRSCFSAAMKAGHPSSVLSARPSSGADVTRAAVCIARLGFQFDVHTPNTYICCMCTRVCTCPHSYVRIGMLLHPATPPYMQRISTGCLRCASLPSPVPDFCRRNV